MTVAEMTAEFQKLCTQIGYGEIMRAKAQRQIDAVDKQRDRLVEAAVDIDDRIPMARQAEASE